MDEFKYRDPGVSISHVLRLLNYPATSVRTVPGNVNMTTRVLNRDPDHRHRPSEGREILSRRLNVGPLTGTCD